MGNKIFNIKMHKAITLFCLIVIVGQLSAFSMPSALCKPARKIGQMIAAGVMKCAVPKRHRALQALKKAPKKGKAKVKVHIKVKPGKKPAKKPSKKRPSKKQQKNLANKIVNKMLAKIGCKRRLFLSFLKKGFNFVKKHAKAAFKKVKKFAKGFACKKFRQYCPKACKWVLKKTSKMLKKLSLPTKC